MEDAKKKYDELLKQKNVTVEDVYFNFSFDDAKEPDADLFYKNIEVLFYFQNEERRSGFYPGYPAEINVHGVFYKGEHYLEDSLDPRSVKWLEKFLLENRGRL